MKRPEQHYIDECDPKVVDYIDYLESKIEKHIEQHLIQISAIKEAVMINNTLRKQVLEMAKIIKQKDLT